MTEAASGAGLEYIKPEGAFYLFCKVPAPGGKEGVDNKKDFGDGLLRALAKIPHTLRTGQRVRLPRMVSRGLLHE